jgi:hypothetical protein
MTLAKVADPRWDMGSPTASVLSRLVAVGARAWFLINTAAIFAMAFSTLEYGRLYDPSEWVRVWHWGVPLSLCATGLGLFIRLREPVKRSGLKHGNLVSLAVLSTLAGFGSMFWGFVLPDVLARSAPGALVMAPGLIGSVDDSGNLEISFRLDGSDAVYSTTFRQALARRHGWYRPQFAKPTLRPGTRAQFTIRET